MFSRQTNAVGFTRTAWTRRFDSSFPPGRGLGKKSTGFARRHHRLGEDGERSRTIRAHRPASRPELSLWRTTGGETTCAIRSRHLRAATTITTAGAASTAQRVPPPTNIYSRSFNYTIYFSPNNHGPFKPRVNIIMWLFGKFAENRVGLVLKNRLKLYLSKIWSGGSRQHIWFQLI